MDRNATVSTCVVVGSAFGSEPGATVSTVPTTDAPWARAPGLIGDSPVLGELLAQIEAFAASAAPVLITGESGTGKELVARALHGRSARRRRPFVAVNCAAMPESLLEAELFGHERGAFTGAFRRRIGRFEAANHGTLFLDEVGDLPLPAQAKLLRALESSVVEPLGTSAGRRIDVRILSATHGPLAEQVAAGRFRDDLYYRLKVLHVSVPPLRQRKEDLRPLVESFIARLAEPGRPKQLTARAWAALEAYPFPGNVRELLHAIERALVMARGDCLDLVHLPAEVAGAATAIPEAVRPKARSAPAAEEAEAVEAFEPLPSALRQFERGHIERALLICRGNRTRAAGLLGISRKNLWEKMRGYDLAASSHPRVMVAPTEVSRE